MTFPTGKTVTLAGDATPRKVVGHKAFPGARLIIVEEGPPAPAIDHVDAHDPGWSDIPAAEASRRSADAIARFFDRLLSGAGEHAGVRGTVGLGKTDAVIKQLTRPELAGLRVNYYAPEHRLNGELLERFNAEARPGSPLARVVLGRGQIAADGTPMCRKAEIAAQVQALGKSVQSHLCFRADNDRCEHFDACPYQRQRADKEPGVRFMAHAHLFIKSNDAMPAPDAVVIDESFWNASVRGTDARNRYYVTMHRLEAAREVPRLADSDKMSNDDTADLAEFSARCAAAIKAGGSLQAFRDYGVTATEARDAEVMEYRRADADKLDISPGMAASTQETIIAGRKAAEALKFARFFKLLKRSLTAGVEPKFIRYEQEATNGDGNIEERVCMAWSADIKTDGAPVLLIDAHLDAEIVRRFLPDMGEIVEANARLGGYRATQITDEVVGKARIVPTSGDDGPRRANRRAEMLRLAEVEASRGKVLMVTYKAAEEALRDEAKALQENFGANFSNLDFAHWNALRGHDQWKDVDTLIVAGRPQPDVDTIERLAEALWYLGKPIEKVEAIEGNKAGKMVKTFHPEARSIVLADGGRHGVEVDVLPDPRCTLLLDQIRAEVMQAIGRARLVYRAEDQPCRVIILGTLPLPMRVHELSTWADVMPGPVGVMQARGIVLDRAEHAAKVLGDWFASAKALQCLIGRSDHKMQVAKCNPSISQSPVENSYREMRNGTLAIGHLPLEEVHYRVIGDRYSSRALVDRRRHPNPLAALERVLGPVEAVRVKARKAGDGEALGRVLAEIARAEAAGEPHTSRSLRAIAGACGPFGVNKAKLAEMIKQAIGAGEIVLAGKRTGGRTLSIRDADE